MSTENQLATQDRSVAIRQQWESLFMPECRKLLGSDDAAGAFVRVIMTALNKVPLLMRCSDMSLMAAVLDCATLKLEPNTPRGLCYLIPRKVDGVLVANLEIGYRGYCELAYRSGKVSDIDGNVIRDGDHIEYREGTDAYVHFMRALGTGRMLKPILGAYVVIVMKDGTKHIKVQDADQLKAFEDAMLRQNRDKGATPAWKFFGDEMRVKCVLKRVAKMLPLGEDVAKAIEIEHRRELELPPTPAETALRFADETTPQALPEKTVAGQHEPARTTSGEMDEDGNFLF